MAQNVVRRDDMEIEIRQDVELKIRQALHRPRGGSCLPGHAAVFGTFKLLRFERFQVRDVLADPSKQLGKLVSLSSCEGTSTPASRAAPPRALSVAIWICRASGNMSGYRRPLISTLGSIFLASACAAALSRIATRLLSNLMNTGTDALIHRNLHSCLLT